MVQQLTEQVIDHLISPIASDPISKKLSKVASTFISFLIFLSNSWLYCLPFTTLKQAPDVNMKGKGQQVTKARETCRPKVGVEARHVQPTSDVFDLMHRLHRKKDA